MRIFFNVYLDTELHASTALIGGLPAWRTILSGALITALGLSIAAVAYGGGYVISAWGYPMLFATGSGFSLAAAPLFFAYFRRPRGRLAHQSVAKKMEIAGAATPAKVGAANE